ncbi:MAG: hypothetical protein QM578_10260 [Pantoea sp.]|uniref:hypothetical protein n=1 Tax=Pantoea sp. TaxID=69393 RepID=UPI0039E458B4
MKEEPPVSETGLAASAPAALMPKFQSEPEQHAIHSINEINEACSIGREDECSKKKCTEIGRFSGGLAGGYIGGEYASDKGEYLGELFYNSVGK